MSEDRKTSTRFELNERGDEVVELVHDAGKRPEMLPAVWVGEPELLMDEDGVLVHREELPDSSDDAVE